VIGDEAACSIDYYQRHQGIGEAFTLTKMQLFSGKNQLSEFYGNHLHEVILPWSSDDETWSIPKQWPNFCKWKMFRVMLQPYRFTLGDFNRQWSDVNLRFGSLWRNGIKAIHCCRMSKRLYCESLAIKTSIYPPKVNIPNEDELKKQPIHRCSGIYSEANCSAVIGIHSSCFCRSWVTVFYIAQ